MATDLKPVLALQDKKRLGELESVIQKGLRTFYEVGCALAEIRDSRLYCETHSTFEDYCRDRWDIARRTAYQLIEASVVVENVRNCAQIIPTNESQARPLTKLGTKQLQQEAWQKAVETAPEGKITAKHVSSIVKEMAEEPMLATVTKLHPESTHAASEARCDVSDAISFATMAIAQLERIQDDDTKWREAFDEVKKWIEKETLRRNQNG